MQISEVENYGFSWHLWSGLPFDDGYVFAPYKNWSKLDEREKSRISTQANKEYISFLLLSVIDGKITDSKAQFTGVRELLDKLESNTILIRSDVCKFQSTN